MSEHQRTTLWRVAAVAGLVTLLGFAVAPERTFASVLLAAVYVIGIGLAGMLFLAFAAVTGAGWSVVFRRVPEAMAATLPVGAAFLAVALAGMPWLYEWTHSHDHLIEMKSGWLNTGFFVVRALVCMGLWLAFAAAFRRRARRQDATPAGTSVRLGALFLVAFAFSFSIASFDWIMSLEAHWFSTVFAMYNASGVFLSGLAVITLVVIALRRGPLRGLVTEEHLHDLGRLMFGFATFWAYLWFCQYMLIWYSNIPEETAYYAARMKGAWGPLSVLNPAVNWLVPFLVLLPRPAKRSWTVMFWVAVLLLVGRWLDLYMMILPSFLPESPALGFWEVAPVALALPLVCIRLFRVFSREPAVPQNDPFLPESLHHHT